MKTESREKVESGEREQRERKERKERGRREGGEEGGLTSIIYFFMDPKTQSSCVFKNDSI